MSLTHDDAPSGTPISDATTADEDVSALWPVPPQRRTPHRLGRRDLQRRVLRRHHPVPRDPRRREMRSRGTERRARPHRRRVGPSPAWRLFVATTGAVLLVLVSGMALGIVTVSPSGLGLKFTDTAQRPPLVTGTDGVYPGGEPRSVSLTVRNTVASAFEIGSVSADLHALPASCPAAAWRIGPPELLPTVPARSEVTVPLPVALATDAPDTCQGVTVRFRVVLDGLRHPLRSTTPGSSITTATVPTAAPSTAAPSTPGAAGSGTAGASAPGATAGGLRPERLETVAVVTTARLAGPGGSLSVHDGHVGVLPSPGTGGPVPSSYDIEVLDASAPPATPGTVVCNGVAGLCLDRGSPPAAARQYVVTARVGAHWRRRSAALRAWTPPPVPGLRFDGGTTGLTLTAAGGASSYEVAVYADDAVAPFHTARVAAGGSLREAVTLPHLGAGDHRFVAVARFHGWRAPSGTVRLTVSGGGAPAPHPVEDPAPLTSDPAHPPLTTDGPPVPALPTSTVPATTRQTRTTPRSTTAPAPRPDGPPQETLPDGPVPSSRSTQPAPGPVAPVLPVAPPARTTARVTAIPVPTLPG